MAKGKIDFKGAAMKAAGHAAGAAAYTQINKLAFMTKLAQKAGPVKGLVTAALGYIAIPMLAEKLKLSGKGSKAEIISYVGEGVGMIGIMQAANAQFPPAGSKNGLFPAIAGYEDSPVGLITEEDEVSGYEESPVMGVEEYADNGVAM